MYRGCGRFSFYRGGWTKAIKNRETFAITLHTAFKERDGLAKGGSDWLLDSRLSFALKTV